MQSNENIIAESAWIHRLLSGGLARATVRDGTFRIEKLSGEALVEIPIGSIDAISVRRSWFKSELAIRVAGGDERSIGGLKGAEASLVRVSVIEWASRQAAETGPRLERIASRLSGSFTGDRYVRHSDVSEVHAALYAEVGQCGGLVQERLGKAASERLAWLESLASEANFEKARERANASYVDRSLPRAKAVAAISLTDEQAEAIATDEDTTLVLAGAGTGKTPVIVGKIAHLVRNLDVSPLEILVVAYNRKAADEIHERLDADLTEVDVFTFHAFGRRVIAETEGAPSVSKLAEDDYAATRAVKRILHDILEHPRESDTLIEFIAYHLSPYQSAFDFEGQEEYDEYVRSVELRTLSGTLVKSYEELVIANFLTENGIGFRYEAQHPWRTVTRLHRQYQPDFYLPHYDIYIEHFALDEVGNPPSKWSGYADGVAWKRGIHVQHGTTLVETYSWQHRQAVLQSELRASLEELGVPFGRAPRETLIRRLGRERISWLAGLLTTFLNHVKSGGVSVSELHSRAARLGDRRRGESFIDVFKHVYDRYQGLLVEEEVLDFHDLINRAARLISAGAWKSRYRYILVDDFQDISAGRMALLTALRGPGTAFFVVGDDWQSIYRFAGSDVGLMRDCGAHLGHVRERTLSRTFRYSDGILGPSAAFVRRNPEQTQRPLTSENTVSDEGITVIAGHAAASGLALALKDMEMSVAGKRCKVLVLGRYRRSRRALSSIRSSEMLSAEFSTVHRAKGREADYVVVLDLEDGKWGFPSQKEDDPLLELVLPPRSGASYPFAEERRLFYVALTRARMGVYLVTDSARSSTFVLELLHESRGMRVFGELAPECPRCSGGRLVPSQSGRNLRCSRHPHCAYLAPGCPNCKNGYVFNSGRGAQTCTNRECKNPPSACPSCGIGVLVERRGRYGRFLGCTEYRSESSCRYTVDLEGVVVRSWSE